MYLSIKVPYEENIDAFERLGILDHGEYNAKYTTNGAVKQCIK